MERSIDNDASTQPSGDGSEADFLAEQAAAAQRALTVTLERMRADLGESADLSAWTERYPWPTVGIAAAAGFLAVVAIGSPSRRSSESSSSLGEGDEPAGGRPARGRRAAERDRGLFHGLMSEVLRNLATAVQGALVAAIGARFQPPPAPPGSSPPVADPTADAMAAGAGGNGFASSSDS